MFLTIAVAKIYAILHIRPRVLFGSLALFSNILHKKNLKQNERFDNRLAHRYFVNKYHYIFSHFVIIFRNIFRFYLQSIRI